MNNRSYLWIAIGAVAGALLAVVIPGLSIGFGIPIGVAVGIAAGLERPRGRRGDQQATGEEDAER